MNRLTLVLILLTAHNLFSQTSDYIQTDTSMENGVDIIYRGLRANCRNVELWRARAKVLMTPDQLKGYFIAPDHYYTSGWLVQGDTSFRTFAREIKGSGKQLFEYKGDLGYLILRKTGDSLHFIPEDRLAAEVAAFYPSDTNVAAMVQNIGYSDNAVEYFFESMEDSPKAARTYFAVESGLNVTSFYSEGFDAYFHSVPTDLNYGLGVRYVIPTNHYLDLTLGVFLTQYRIQSDSSSLSTTSYRLRAGQFQYFGLLKYKVAEGNVRPYLALGPRVSHQISPSHLGQVQTAADTLAHLDFQEEGYFPETYIHVGTFMGVEFQLSSQNLLYFESRYFYQLNQQEGLLRRNDFQFVMGFSF